MMGSHEPPDSVVELARAYGSEFAKPEYYTDEHPQHLVQLNKSFYLGIYEVTVGQFRQFVKGSRLRHRWRKGR